MAPCRETVALPASAEGPGPAPSCFDVIAFCNVVKFCSVCGLDSGSLAALFSCSWCHLNNSRNDGFAASSRHAGVQAVSASKWRGAGRPSSGRPSSTGTSVGLVQPETVNPQFLPSKRSGVAPARGEVQLKLRAPSTCCLVHSAACCSCQSRWLHLHGKQTLLRHPQKHSHKPHWATASPCRGAAAA